MRIHLSTLSFSKDKRGQKSPLNVFNGECRPNVSVVRSKAKVNVGLQFAFVLSKEDLKVDSCNNITILVCKVHTQSPEIEANWATLWMRRQ